MNNVLYKIKGEVKSQVLGQIFQINKVHQQVVNRVSQIISIYNNKIYDKIISKVYLKIENPIDANILLQMDNAITEGLDKND